VYLKQVIESEECCGIISPTSFTVNLKSFRESISANSCLFKKVGIDQHGNIKNCPSMKTAFGNVKNISQLSSIIRGQKFQKNWKITKDQISVCKDCEFRHVCSDCRAYLEEPENSLSKPLKCNYHPYTASWTVDSVTGR